MKPLPIAVFVLCVCSAGAQVSITNSDMVGAGDSVRVSYAASTGTADYTVFGPNYLWDFSQLAPYAQQVMRYDQPSAFPFTSMATVAHVNLSPDSIPGLGIIPSDFTDYYKSSSSSFRQVGSSFLYPQVINFPIPVIYSSSDHIYNFPLDYPDHDTSDAAWSFNAQSFGLFYIGETIHRESAVDGWGTLITPFGTFQCLRQVSYVTKVDINGLDSVNGYVIQQPLQVQYKWLASSMKIPVLEVDASVINSNEVVTGVTYQDSLRSNLFQVGVQDPAAGFARAGIFPNPAVDHTDVQLFSAQESEVDITLYDNSGRMVRNYGTRSLGSGETVITLDLSGLAAGIYKLQVAGRGQLYCGKIAICGG